MRLPRKGDQHERAHLMKFQKSCFVIVNLQTVSETLESRYVASITTKIIPHEECHAPYTPLVV